MQPDCDLLPIKGTFVSQSKHLYFFRLPPCEHKNPSSLSDCGSVSHSLALQQVLFLLTRKKTNRV